MKSKIKIFAFKWVNGDAEWVAAENKEQAINCHLSSFDLTREDLKRCQIEEVSIKNWGRHYVYQDDDECIGFDEWMNQNNDFPDIIATTWH